MIEDQVDASYPTDRGCVLSYMTTDSTGRNLRCKTVLLVEKVLLYSVQGHRTHGSPSTHRTPATKGTLTMNRIYQVPVVWKEVFVVRCRSLRTPACSRGV
jgi:hypothetical protein